MAEAKPGRRHLRLTITEDMQDLWAWFQNVRPRAAAREVEFLLRVGVLSATGLRTAVPPQAGHRAAPDIAAVGASATAAAGEGARPAAGAPALGQAEDDAQPGEEPVRARASGFNHAAALQM